MLNQNVETVVVKVQMIKNLEKVNLTYSVSNTVNLTGRIIECKNFFPAPGRDMSDYVLQSKVTALLPIELGKEILLATKEIFAQRMTSGDPNPVVDITYYCHTLIQKSGYLLTDVVDFCVSSDTNVLQQNKEVFDEAAFIQEAQRIREETAASNNAALEASRLGKPFRNLNNQAAVPVSKPILTPKLRPLTTVVDGYDFGF